MTWIEWVGAIIGGLFVVNALFIGALFVASWIGDRRERHEKRSTG